MDPYEIGTRRLARKRASRHVPGVGCANLMWPGLEARRFAEDDNIDGTDLYIAPSTAFVRPGYAELARVGPGDEFGRNDEAREIGASPTSIPRLAPSVPPYARRVRGA